MLPGPETRFQVLQCLIDFAYLHVHYHKFSSLTSAPRLQPSDETMTFREPQ